MSTDLRRRIVVHGIPLLLVAWFAALVSTFWLPTLAHGWSPPLSPLQRVTLVAGGTIGSDQAWIVLVVASIGLAGIAVRHRLGTARPS